MTLKPDPNQSYSVPQEFRSNFTTHDRALYSMWNHFTETCQRSRMIQLEDYQHVDLLLRKRTGGCSCAEEKQCHFENGEPPTPGHFYAVAASNMPGSAKSYLSRHYDDESLTWVNKYLGEESESKRLQVFIKLSNGISAECQHSSVVETISNLTVHQKPAALCTTSAFEKKYPTQNSHFVDTLTHFRSPITKDFQHSTRCNRLSTGSPLGPIACISHGSRAATMSVKGQNSSFASVTSRSPSPALSTPTSATSNESSAVDAISTIGLRNHIRNKSSPCAGVHTRFVSVSSATTPWLETSQLPSLHVPNQTPHPNCSSARHLKEGLECNSPLSTQSDLTMDSLSVHFEKCELTCNRH